MNWEEVKKYNIYSRARIGYCDYGDGHNWGYLSHFKRIQGNKYLRICRQHYEELRYAHVLEKFKNVSSDREFKLLMEESIFMPWPLVNKVKEAMSW